MNAETQGITQGNSHQVPVPPGALLKTIAADPKTTNLLLAILVLCMSGLMPEQFNTLCS